MNYKYISTSIGFIIIVIFITVGSSYPIWKVWKSTEEVPVHSSNSDKQQIKNGSVSENQEAINSVTSLSEHINANRKLANGVIETLRAEGKVFVVIALSRPRAPSIDLPALKEEIAGLQESVLSELSPSEFRLAQKYATIPSVSGFVLNEDGLTKLASNPQVVRIDLDVGGGGGSKY